MALIYDITKLSIPVWKDSTCVIGRLRCSILKLNSLKQELVFIYKNDICQCHAIDPVQKKFVYNVNNILI